MRSLFLNIDPEASEAARRVWEIEDAATLAALARELLERGGLEARCALFDRFSYSRTTEGERLSGAFDGLEPAILADARRTLDGLWGEGSFPEAVAGCVHVLWRAVDLEDARRIERALRSEEHWRVLWPAVSAASLLRGEDPAFDRATAPLLAAVAERPALPPLVRRLAIQALGVAAGDEEAALLEGLVDRLGVPEAAMAALVLLDQGRGDPRALREAARRWPPSDEYPVPDARDRIAAL